MKLLVILALCLYSFVLSVEAFGGSGINSVVSSLASYQSESGGFQATKTTPPNLQDTSNAIFISALFGLTEKEVEAESAIKFISELKNPNHGYSNVPGQPSDMVSTSNALATLVHLGETVDPQAAQFIHYLYDSHTKLFSNTFGGNGDFKSTALALQSFELLGLLDSDDVVKKKAEIKGALEKYLEKGHFSSLTSDNHYGVAVATLCGLQVDQEKYFVDRQIATGPSKGGFYSESSFVRKETSVEDAAHALSALYHLGGGQPVKSVDVTSLVSYLNSLPSDLTTAAHAFTALARTDAIHDLFKTVANYRVRQSNVKVGKSRIIEGTVFKPQFSAASTFGLSHGSLDVSLTISSGADSNTIKLEWDPETQMYITEEYFDTTGKFGDLSLDYTFKWTAPFTSGFVGHFKETKKVGFDITVKSKVTFDGKAVAPSGVVGVGSSFDFQVSLGTVETPLPGLKGGEFDVALTVLDSSLVSIHTENFDARGNSEDISIGYTFEASNVPGGSLTFRFTVSNAEGAHTVEELVYSYQVPIVAAAISFSQPSTYNIGQNVQVTMEPGNMVDTRTVNHYGEGERKFFMDVRSHTRKVLFSQPGTVSFTKGYQSYTFTFPVEANFDFLGTNILTFRYQSVSGDVQLQNYDSQAQGLFEEGDDITYTVESNLEVVDVKGAPRDGALSYGNEIEFTFKVKDSLTDTLVWSGSEASTAYLVLRNVVGGAPFVSSKQAAAQISKDDAPSHFSVKWAVNPNAVKGAGSLELIAQGSAGKEISLSEGGKPWQKKVNIGGRIDVSPNTFSAPMNEEDTVFLADFRLSCEGVSLKDAELTAKISFVASSGEVVPVTQAPVAVSGTGYYEVSWILDSSKANAGTYSIEIYREVDLARGSNPDSLFSFTHEHTKPFQSPLPIKTQFLVLFILIISYFSASIRKMELEGRRKVHRKKK